MKNFFIVFASLAAAACASPLSRTIHDDLALLEKRGLATVYTSCTKASVLSGSVISILHLLPGQCDRMYAYYGWRTVMDANNSLVTFDDGPWKYHEQVSQELLKAGAKGTFFINGNNCEHPFHLCRVFRKIYYVKRRLRVWWPIRVSTPPIFQGWTSDCQSYLVASSSDWGT